MTARDSLPEAVARLARFAKDLGKPSALIGGVAVIARAFVRATKDVDLLVACPVTETQAVLDAAKLHGYEWDPTELPDFREAGLLRMWGPPSRREGLGLDVLLTDSKFNDEVVEHATLVEVLGTQIRVATPEDLLLMKLEANRPVDVDDSIAIKDAYVGRLDLSYLRSQADRLGSDVRRRLDLLLPLA